MAKARTKKTPAKPTPIPRKDELLQAARQAEAEGIKAMNERLTQLISGQIQPPNSTVKYLVDKYRESRGQYDELSKQINQMTQMLEEGKKKLLVLQGQTNSYAEDIRNWDKEVIQESGKPKGDSDG